MFILCIYRWGVVNARRQKKGNMLLGLGLAYFSVTMTYCWFSDKTVFYTVPRHLIEVPSEKK